MFGLSIYCTFAGLIIAFAIIATIVAVLLGLSFIGYVAFCFVAAF